jgi:hypothetical protein
VAAASGLALLVGLVQGLVAGGQVALAAGFLAVALPAGGFGFGGSAEGG